MDDDFGDLLDAIRRDRDKNEFDDLLEAIRSEEKDTFSHPTHFERKMGPA